MEFLLHCECRRSCSRIILQWIKQMKVSTGCCVWTTTSPQRECGPNDIHINIVRFAHCTLFSSNNFIGHARAFYTRATIPSRHSFLSQLKPSHEFVVIDIDGIGGRVCVCSLRTVVVCQPCVSIAFNWRGRIDRSVFVCLFSVGNFSVSVSGRWARIPYTSILLWFAHESPYSGVHSNQIVQ